MLAYSKNFTNFATSKHNQLHWGGTRVKTATKTMKNLNKAELAQWIRDLETGCGFYVFVNGGGIHLISDDIREDFINDILSDNYSEPEILTKGTEHEEFKDIMDHEEYEGTDCFILVPHNTGYNQENFDIQIQYWEA